MKITHRLAALAAVVAAGTATLTMTLPSAAEAAAAGFPTCDLSEKVKELQRWDTNNQYNIIVWKESARASSDLRGVAAQDFANSHECKNTVKHSNYFWAAFREGTFVHQGDGGYRNWAFVGNFQRDGETVRFFPR
ncbi:hypothetical protein [Crossiella cryophila]|uniref:Uncharacterized protein n=1 Tax=Crossiella cryophila TaxID=43355 RepID=A0A7W7CBY3_9PSEU|nr:hypothetical protein [Crossiella cryophila]MBB4677086.1 hypothetical protein [Crossiella cryophila]